jgi:recombination protein RecA
VRIDLRRVESLKQGAEVVGIRVRARVVKNKMAPPFRSAEFDIMFKRGKCGISKEGDIIDLGVALGIVKKAGTFFTYGDLKLGQGRENARDYLWQHSDVASNIEREIRATAMSLPSPSAETKEVSE